MNYTVVETNLAVDSIEPDLVTRFRWRADRRCRKLNAAKLVVFYRWEVVPSNDGRWMVVAFQNIAWPL